MTSPPPAETEQPAPQPVAEPAEPTPPPAETEAPLELTSVTVDLAGMDLSDLLSVGQRIETTAADIYLNAGDPGLILIDTTLRLRDRTRRVEPLPLTMFMKAVPAEASSIIASFTSEKDTPNE